METQYVPQSAFDAEGQTNPLQATQLKTIARTSKQFGTPTWVSVVIVIALVILLIIVVVLWLQYRSEAQELQRVKANLAEAEAAYQQLAARKLPRRIQQIPKNNAEDTSPIEEERKEAINKSLEQRAETDEKYNFDEYGVV